jgi:membrane peptidoglycan carboxypeptidase
VPYWIEMVREQLVSSYGSSTVLGGGLRVYLSVDLELQKAAEESIAQILDQPGDPSAALVCVDVRTGRMVAMVGGSDFSKLQFNLATQGRRQPGSAFKPFVLVTALQQGMSPDTTYASGPITIELPDGPWDVTSTDKGPLTLAQATAESSNGVYARLIMDLGADKVAQTAYDMGIRTSLGDHPNPAIALGGLTNGVSPLEMAMAYATLATGGERIASQTVSDPSETGYPITIVRVTDAEGRVLDEASVARTRVLGQDVAALATSCLQRAIQSGTGTAADIERPAAGKTGTTSDYRDAWFVGYTPELVTAVWVGYPTEQTPMTDVHGLKVTGGSFPAEIWAAFMEKALADVPVSDFEQSSLEGWVSVEVCSESHLLPTDYCPTKVTMRFRSEDAPTTQCVLHVAQEVAVPDLHGLSLTEAQAVLTEAHFVVASVDERSSSAPAGTVVGQKPAAHTLLMQGSVVTLLVSTGETLTPVPALVGLDITSARTLLAAAGLLSTENVVADVSAPGTVLSQDPAPDTLLTPGTSVVLFISSGPDEVPATAAPQ